MGLLSSLLLLLACLWLLQVVGTVFQMRHYRRVLGGITRARNSGYVGTGNARARFGRGVVAILVSDEEGVVREALRMRGFSVFARFGEASELVGLEVEELRDEGRDGPYGATTMLAVRRAVEQVDRIKAEREVGAGVD